MDIPLKSKPKVSVVNLLTNHQLNQVNQSPNGSLYSPNTAEFTVHSSTDLERHFPAEILAPISLSMSNNNTPIKLSPQESGNAFTFNSSYDSDVDSDVETPPAKLTINVQKRSQPRKKTRTYSETETSNFHKQTGERLFDDEKYRPKHTEHFYIQENEPLSLSKTHIPIAEDFGRDLTGLEDEYIPGLDFSNVIYQWFDDSRSNSAYNSAGVTPNTSYLDLNQLHSQVAPKPIIRNKSPLKETSLNFDNYDYEAILSKLPSNFIDLPFSQRRKLIKGISPSIDYSQFSLFAKKNLKRSSSTTYASLLIDSLSKSPVRPRPQKINIDDKGSIILEHELGNVIGFGAWGVIRECVGNGVTRAIKIVRTKNPEVSRYFKREVSIWRVLKHKNILPLLDELETDYATFCITNRIYGGTLFDIVQKWGIYNNPNTTITQEARMILTKKYTLDILEGLGYMHGIGIVHGDVKLENCLYDEHLNSVVLCDFGMSTYFSKDYNKLQRRPSIIRSRSSQVHLKKSRTESYLKSPNFFKDDTRFGISNIRKNHGPAPQSMGWSDSRPTTPGRDTSPSPLGTVVNVSDFSPYNDRRNSTPDGVLNSDLPHSHIGSLPYASPELILPSPPPLGPSADIWAFGVLLYTMLVGKLPFQHSYEPRLRAIISAGKFDYESLTRACEGYELFVDIVKGCLEVNITRRWDLDLIIEKMNSR